MVEIPALAAQPRATRVETPAAAPDPLREAAEAFEAVFLAEMLAHAGMGEMKGEFCGGVGEAAFSSLLPREWADRMAASGGIGLADRIYQDLATRAGDV